MAGTPESLLKTFDYVWGRTLTRIEGLGDDEYFWEPVPGCWTLRLGGDGRWQLDGGGGGGPAPEPVPITTIAWRIGHLGAMALGGLTEMRFGRERIAAAAKELPGTSSEVKGFLNANYRTWREALAGLDDAGWNAPLGPSWGEYADDDTFDLALHVLDEVVHHAAEVGLMRDLYLRCNSVGTDGT